MADTSPPPPPSGATPQKSTAPATPQPPTVRELRPPPYMLRTPDGLSSYFDRENYRIVMSPHEPLSAFLAPAKYVEDKTPQPGHARQRVEYDLSAFDASTFAPMEAVPSSVLAALEAAVKAFYERVDDPASKATDHEKRLRRGFRLPDPDKEKDAYWLHGPRDDRKLLVLWGTETVRGSALPLVARSDAGGTAGVVDKLRSRGMPWQVLQREAVALVIERRRPLSEFLATAVRDRNGAITAVIHAGKNIPKDKLAPLGNIGAGEIGRFEKAVNDFYTGAQDGAEGITAYEKELRRALRLPDPDKRPGQYFKHGGKLLVVVQGDETPDSVLCPGPDATLGLPPEEKGPDGAAFVPETVIDKLRRRATPVKARIIMAAAAALIVVAALVALEVFADRTPPKILRVVAENDPTTVRVVFDEKVDPESIESTTDNPEPIRVRAPGGRFVAVSSIALAAGEPATVELKVEPLGEGDYEVVLRGVRDASRKANTVAPDTTKSFAFSDTLPPKLVAVSAHGEDPTKLVLIFDEPLDPRTLRDRQSYQIPGFTVRGAEAGKSAEQVVLTADKPFENRARYSLAIDGVADRAGNIPSPAITRDFDYVDTIPPALERIEAAASQVRVQLTFSKRLGGAAANPSLYSVEAQGQDGWSPVEIRIARVPDDKKPVVELITAPLRNGVLYRAIAKGVPDRAEPANILESTEPVQFRFTGQEDKTPPGLGRPRVREGTNNREIEVTFSEEVTEESARRPENYGFVENAPPITEVDSADGAMVRTVILRTASPLAQGSRLTLRASGITDFVGNTNDEAVSEQFWVSGMGIPEDTTLRIVSAAVAANGAQIKITFNENLSAQAASQVSNYSVSGAKRIARAEFSSSKPKEVTLHLDGSTPLTRGNYAVTARNLTLSELPDFLQHSVTASVVVN
jgi:hypothetical protein